MVYPLEWPIPSVTDGFATIAGVSTLALNANPRRMDTDFTNNSIDWIYLGRGNAAVIGSGIPLSPNGGTYHIGPLNLFLGPVYAINDGGEQNEANLAISEGHKP